MILKSGAETPKDDERRGTSRKREWIEQRTEKNCKEAGSSNCTSHPNVPFLSTCTDRHVEKPKKAQQNSRLHNPHDKTDNPKPIQDTAASTVSE